LKKRGNKMGRKPGSTIDKKEAILSECIMLIAEKNISHGDWIRYTAEKYDFGQRWAEKLWSEAWSQIKERYSQKADENLSQALLRLDTLYADARERGADWNSLANIAREKNKLLGLGKENIEVKSSVKLSFEFNSDEE
jgi:hypothetical protein